MDVENHDIRWSSLSPIPSLLVNAAWAICAYIYINNTPSRIRVLSSDSISWEANHPWYPIKAVCSLSRPHVWLSSPSNPHLNLKSNGNLLNLLHPIRLHIRSPFPTLFPTFPLYPQMLLSTLLSATPIPISHVFKCLYRIYHCCFWTGKNSLNSGGSSYSEYSLSEKYILLILQFAWIWTLNVYM